MRIYIKSDFTKNIMFDYRYLAGKMWFEEKNRKKVDVSYFGNINIFKDDPTIHLNLNKWIHDSRWENIPLKEGITNEFSTQKYENIELDFENNPATDYRERGDHLRIATKNLELLTVDKRAMFIMAIEIAIAIDGQISEDDKATWISVDEFKKRHQEILSLTYDEANEMSLKEIQTIEPIPDPIWAEDDRRNAEYIEIHGEPDYDEEEDEEETEDGDEDNEETNNYPKTESDNWFG